MDDERFDGLYLNVAQTTRGIEPLLDTVFSFLRRKTDFFAGPPGADDGTAAATAKVNEVLRKHADLYQKDKLLREEKKKKKTTTTTTTTTAKPKPKKTVTQPFKTTKQDDNSNNNDDNDEEEIIEMSTEGGFDVSKPVVSKKPVLTPIGKISLDEKEKESSPPSPSPSPGKKSIEIADDDDDEKDDNNNNGNDEEDEDPPPEGNGGSVPGKYVWTQTLAEVTVNVPVPENTRGRDVQVTIKRSHLRIALKGTPVVVVVVDSDLTKPIVCDDSFWTIEDGNRLVVNLQKLNPMEWWECVCRGDPTINVRNIRPENSSLSDLDGETRKTVEKMMFDQRQKAIGKPTSDEQQKLDALEMFKRQHPEMDFSNAKIS